MPNEKGMSRGMPRWVRVLSIFAIAMIGLAVIAVASGLHQPRRHWPAADSGRDAVALKARSSSAEVHR